MGEPLASTARRLTSVEGAPVQADGGADIAALKSLIRRLYLAYLSLVIACFALVRRAGGLRAARYDPQRVRRILVLRFGLLGDAALLAPALRSLKRSFPDAEVHVLATPLQAPLLEPLPFVDRVLTWRAGDLLEPRQALKPWAWRAAAGGVAELRAQGYDLALSCYGQLGSAIALLSGVPHRFGYASECFPFTLTQALPGGRYDRPWHEAQYNVAIFAAAGAEDDDSPVRLTVAPDAQAAAQAKLMAAGAALTPGASAALVVIHAGATNGPAKRWPVRYWASLASSLAKDGLRVVLVGGPQDRRLAMKLTSLARRPPVNLVGQTSVPELLALLDEAAVVVSGDSGPVHLAVALGRPTVAIHGPTDPAILGPYDLSQATVVRHPLPCSPCYSLKSIAICPLGHTLCQRLISPATVYQGVRAALNERQELPARPLPRAKGSQGTADP